MNEITASQPVSAETLENVLANGNLNDLTPEQRVAYYFRVCESLGLNPYTRPFDYITLNGKRVLYAKRDATDQLRQKRNITLAVTDKHIEDDLFIVTVRATDAKGRSDEDFGAVPITGLKGEARANAILKGITKAKRRVTLSICGLGMNDESEVVTIPGAVTEELLLPPTPDLRASINDAVPLKAAASDVKRAPRISEPPPASKPHPLMPKGPVDPNPVDASKRVQGDIYDQHNIAIELLDVDDSRTWMSNLEMLLAEATSLTAVEVIGECESVKRTIEKAPGSIRARVSELLANACKRFIENDPDHSAEELPDVEIEGADKMAAGD